MRKLFVVFGATGQQGGSIVDYVLKDPELAKQYNIRAVSRDPSKPNAQALKQKGVEVVKGDLSDVSTLKDVLHDAHTVFAVTTPFEGLSKEQEIEHGKTVADVAISVGARFIIWSTLANVTKITNNIFSNIAHFDAKADVEAYIRQLPIKSAFIAMGFFMQNFQAILLPEPVGDGTYLVRNVVKPTTKVPLLHAVGDTGKFVGAILADPEAHEGRVLLAATKMYSFDQIVEIMSQKTGRSVGFVQVPDEMLRKVLPPSHAAELLEMLMFFREYGYYGPETEQMADRTAREARYKLTTFEEYLDQNPLQLG